MEISKYEGSLSNLKAKKINDDTIAFAVSAVTTPSGELHNPASEESSKKHSSARVYTKLFVRHWDTWKGENTSAIWYGALKTKKEGNGSAYTVLQPQLINALKGSKLECPVPPFGGAGDFDIGPAGLVFVSNDPQVNPAIWTKTDLYYVPLSTFTEDKPPVPQVVKTGQLRGYTSSPVFSNDGKKVAFKRMRHNQYESDKPRLLLLPDIKDLTNVQEFYQTDDGEGSWDARPDGVVWSNDDKELYVTAEVEGFVRLHKLPSTPLEAAKNLPEVITSGPGSAGDVFPLAAGKETRLFVNGSSLIDSSIYGVVEPATGKASLVSSATKEGRSFGLSYEQVKDDFWFQGAGDYKAHALVTKPSNFDPTRKYPLAFMIHGGPQGAWNNAWSTRWNPAVFAEQGYVVVCPNPTGSTGYGQAFTDAIAQDWGGRPYDDLVNCFEHITENIPYIDTTRAVALGASYGGYMINWIQGHPLGRKFRALVCHDGIFTTMNDWATEELFFVLHDMGGSIWDKRENYEKWDPAAFTKDWATPQLVIHSELDYRLAVTEGLAAFNVLQARGVPSKLLVFPDENHVSRPLMRKLHVITNDHRLTTLSLL
jgi:dipeptidyl aminopeptidase/acylaminoacyl peptidase